MTEQASNPEMLERARDLVAALEAGESERAEEVLASLTKMHETELFQQLGRLTRDFHEAMNKFRYDERVSTLAQEDIPDAKERLRYVIQRTDDAAHRTMNAVESSLPVCESLLAKSHELNALWTRFTQRELTPQQFRDLSKQLGMFLGEVQGDAETIKKHLTDVLMAQDFQDITGQIIGRVIGLVEEVEQSLVDLIKLGGKGLKPQQNTVDKGKEKETTSLDGPQIPGMESKGVVSGQDEVDDLLSSLGF